MTKRWTAPFLVLGLLILVTAGQAQQQPQRQRSEPPPRPTPESEPALPTDQQTPGEVVDTSDEQTPIFRSGISYIRVDVIATDKDGTPVMDLTADDFEVYEDDVPQEVESFQLIEVDTLPQLADQPAIPVGFTRSDQERAAGQADVRVFVIFLDDYHVREGNSIRVRRMLADFLENELIATDLVGVMNPLMPLDAVRLTRNHQAVINAVNQFQGTKYNYTVRNGYEALYNHYPTETVERVRNDVSLSALRGLMIHLGGLREGRKSVLLVSEGYTSYVPPQLRSDNATMPVDPAVNPARFDPDAGDSALETTFAFFEGSAVMMDLRRVFQTANRFNTSLYTVDPRGLATFEFDLDQPVVNFRTDQRSLRQTQDTLRVLAEETDGRAIVNQNNVRSGLRQMLSDSSSYYLLGYNSSLLATDGKFHEIDVRVKREGVRLRARKGYWAIHRTRRRAVAGHESQRAAQGGRRRAERARRAAPGAPRANVGRQLARGERQDAGDVRLGTDHDAWPTRGGVARAGDGHGRRRRRVLPGPGSRTRARRPWDDERSRGARHAAGDAGRVRGRARHDADEPGHRRGGG